MIRSQPAGPIRPHHIADIYRRVRYVAATSSWSAGLRRHQIEHVPTPVFGEWHSAQATLAVDKSPSFLQFNFLALRRIYRIVAEAASAQCKGKSARKAA